MWKIEAFFEKLCTLNVRYYVNSLSKDWSIFQKIVYIERMLLCKFFE